MHAPWALRIAAAAVLAAAAGIPQAARQAPADALADVLLWGAHLGIDPSAFPQPLRSEVEGYLRRSEAYRSARPGPVRSAEMEMVYETRVRYERLLAGISADASARALAVAYVDDLQPCYEWEGLHECPEREAAFAEKYLAAHAGGPFRQYLPLLAAHRWLCTAEAYASEKQPEAAARSWQAFERQIGVAIKADSLLIRTGAEALMARKKCFAPRQDPPPSCGPEPGRLAEQVRGEVAKGQTFTKATTGGWILRLVPADQGWLLQVLMQTREGEDLSRLTPPFHFVPNPRDLQGWHFRNADNTGPNDGSVNAPQELREFIFSPRVGRNIQGATATAAPTSEEIAAVGAFGRGWFLLESYVLTPPQKGGRAAFVSIRFSACLTWPAGQARLPGAAGAGPPRPQSER